jgi:hypothetical protein
MQALTIPILPSADFDATARFYAPLGFTERGRWAGEYLILHGPHGIELHFWLNPKAERSTNDVACYVRFETSAGAQALHDAWKPHVQPPGQLNRPVTTDYGLLEFALIDPHGNLLRVGGRL